MTANELTRRFPKASRAFIRANLSDSDSRPVAKLESNSSHAPLEKKKVQGSNCERFLVCVTSRRKRLIDEDNLCEKYVVDLLRYAGILPSDAPDKLKIEVAQTKCPRNSPEEITIEIYRSD